MGTTRTAGDLEQNFDDASRFFDENGDLVTLAEARLVIIEAAIQRYDGNKTAVALHLNIARATLYRQMQRGWWQRSIRLGFSEARQVA